MTTIGFIGLGAMGGRMAGRLVAAGHEVYGTNRTASKAAGLIERGLRWRDTPRDVAEAAGVIISMVADDTALDTITAGPDRKLVCPSRVTRSRPPGTSTIQLPGGGTATASPVGRLG